MSLKKEIEQEKEKEKTVVIFGGKVFEFKPAPFGMKTAPIKESK